jgi:hypothetical protein
MLFPSVGESKAGRRLAGPNGRDQLCSCEDFHEVLPSGPIVKITTGPSATLVARPGFVQHFWNRR